MIYTAIDTFYLTDEELQNSPSRKSIVRFSTTRSGEIGRLSMEWAKCLVPLVNSSKVKVLGRCIVASTNLHLMQDVLLYASFYIHKSVITEGDKSSWRLDSPSNIDSTVYPILTLFRLLKTKPYQEFDRRVNASKTSFEGYPWQYCYKSSSLELLKVPSVRLKFALNKSFVDLSYVDFSYACLKNVFFSRANLQCAKFRNLISCVLIVILRLCGAVSVEKLNWKLIKLCLPVNVIFVGMLVSDMYRLLKGLESRYESMAIQFQHLEECFQLYNGFSSILFLPSTSTLQFLLETKH